MLVREENQTLATITLQNYFRLYDKLSGMTGTAMTEDAEFRQIYKLPVMAIPPNRPVIRVDENDLVYRTIDGKFNAVADDIAARHAKGQPCLIGTVSIENSEKLSRLLDKRGIKHETLNAKHHEREAHIVAQAGRLGAVTIATNMAGRGTDIRLGGEPDMLAEDLLRERGFDVDAQEGDEEARGPIPSAADRADALTRAREICDAEQEQVLAAGGLCVIGTERHESRRIDNQLRGRSGRQGDPGVTQFYLSLEDDLMRLFGGSKMDSIAHMMEKTNQEDDMPIQAGMVSKSIESAQRQVESMHFAARKNVLEYDDVMNLQRKAIYEERNAILDGKSMTERIPGIIRDAVDAIVGECCPGNSASDDWDVRAIDLWAANMTGCNDFSVAKVDHEDEAENVAEALNDFLTWIYEQKSEQLGHDLMENLSAQVMLRIIDTRWMAHLQEMDYLKTGIGLRAFGQRDGAVTIATNMAGRGTDIRLGGEPDMLAEDLLRERGFDVDAQEGDEEARGPIPSAADRADALTRAREICDAEQEQVLAAGGLCVIGTERHESRRIDNQLRGRSGRQGDPGVTQFYLSLEDDLMRLFGGSKMDSIAHMMEKTNQEDDMPIQAGMVSKSIESAQRQVESMHFAARKNVLEYDDVMNLQRKAIYEERNAILDGKSMTERIPGIIRDAVDAIVGECCPGNSASDDWDVRAIDLWAANMTGCNDFSVAKVDHEDEAENVAEALNDFLTWIYEQKSEQLGHDLMENLSAQVMLRIIDTRWMAHLQEMDYLKTGIGLRAFGQRDPLVEYKNEAYNAFQNLTSSMYDDYLRTLLRLEIAAKPAAEGAPAGAGRPAPAALAEQEDPLARKMSYSAPEQALEESSIRGRHAAAARAASGVPAAPPKPAAGKPQTYVKDKEDPYANVGRNDPCPCGSGKKFKKCHGQNL